MNIVIDTLKKSRLEICVIVSLVLLTAAVYGQVIGHGFINYDDPDYITENLLVQEGLTREGSRWAFTTFTAANWHPLTWLSHMLDVQLFGVKPGMHHLVSVAFHLLNTILLFVILRQMTGALWRSAFVAALFALHPLHVESVAWAAERKDVLSTFFWLLTMGAYVRYAQKPGLQEYGPVVLFFVLGLLAKPMLVTLPLVLLLLDYWPLGRLKWNDPAPEIQRTAPPEPEKKRKKRTPQPLEKKKKPPAMGAGKWSHILPLVYEKMPLLALSAASGFITYYAQQKGGAVASLIRVPLPERVANAVVSCAAYLWKMVWPSGLAVPYPIEAWSAGAVLASASFLIAMTLVAVRRAGAYPYLLSGWLWYLITLLPVIGIVKVGDAAMADRYTYVTLIGPLVAVSWGARDLAARWSRGRVALTAAALPVVGALAVLTFIQTVYWKSSESLFRHALAVTENNYTAHTNLAVELFAQGSQDEAVIHLETAVRLRPDFPYALYNLGAIRMKQGRSDEAVRYCQSALQYNPNLWQALRCLAFLQLERGEAAEAVRNFEKTLAGRGPDPQVYVGLGDALAMTGRYEEALANYGRALARKPDAAEVHYNAARILIAMGRLDEAIGHLREAVRIKPDYARAHNNLGSALLLQKNIDGAIQHFREAIRIDPDYRIARENLKDAQAQKKPGR
jgi:tetratricopeptide (TPR) repeat protein